MNTFLFLLITLFVFLLPLIPSLIEIIVKADVSALKIWQHHDNRPKNFAIGFAERVQHALSTEAWSVNAESYRIIDTQEKLLTRDELQQIILVKGNACLPSNTNAIHELYVKGNLICDGNHLMRAILVENQLSLGPNTDILRWAHAKSISIEKRSRLKGRITADDAIYFKGEGQFIYLHADQIFFGHLSPKQKYAAEPLSLIDLAKLNNVSYKKSENDRLIIKGDCIVPPACCINGDLIVYGKLHVKDNCHIKGSIKAHGNILLNANATIDGAVVSNASIYIRTAVAIAGPVSAEKRLKIESDTVFGSLSNKTSITSTIILIKGSSLVHGTIRTKRYGVFTQRI